MINPVWVIVPTIIIVLILFFVLYFGFMWCDDRYDAICLEKERFNGGRCPVCANELKYFDTDLKGRRGYYCDNCKYHTWVSYRRIDRNYQ